jgi:hypothetical protein
MSIYVLSVHFDTTKRKTKKKEAGNFFIGRVVSNMIAIET